MIRKIAPFIVMGLLITIIYGLSRQVIEALQTGSRLDKAADSFKKLQDDNRTLKNRLVEVEKDDFIESQARNKLNMAKPGETVVIIPPDELNKVVESYDKKASPQIPNWQKWLQLLIN